MTPPPFDTARARRVAADFPGIPSELLLAAVERLETSGALELDVPPAPDTSVVDHLVYAMDVADTLTPTVRRLDTAGTGLALSWTIDRSIPIDDDEPFRAVAIEARVFYCAGCARLHRRVTLWGDQGQRHDIDIDLEHDSGSPS